MVNNAAVAATLSMVFMPFILFGGFFVNLDDVYVWLSWLQYLSPIRYSTEALVRNEFQNNEKYGEYSKIYEDYNLNLGLGYCIMLLTILAVVLRLLALAALRLKVAKVQ